MHKFPNDFLFCASTCAFQIEGGRNLGQRKDSIWDQFTKNNYYIPKVNETTREINLIDTAADFYHKYETDSKIMKEMGLNGLVYNLDWTRIMPTNDYDINLEGIAFYKNVFASLKTNNVQIIPILFHWDTPLWVEAKGGWTNDKILDSFRIFCQIIFKYLGKSSDIWFVNDENSTFTLLGYLSDYLPPAKKNILDFVKALHFLNLSAAVAKEEFLKAKNKGWVNTKAQIGIVHDWSPPITFQTNKDNNEAVKNYNYWFKNLFLDPNLKGTYPQVWYDFINFHKIDFIILESDLKYLQKYPMDIIGWNYYRPAYIAPINLDENKYQWQKTSESHISNKFKIVYPKNNHVQYTPWNWVIDATQLAPSAQQLYKEYQVPLMIIENGLGTFDKIDNNMIKDIDRIDYLSQHLLEVKKAINLGVPFLGYSLWTYCDIFSPSGGYRKRYGLVSVDFSKHNLPRTPKLSYVWYQNVIASRGKSLFTKRDDKQLVDQLQNLLKQWKNF